MSDLYRIITTDLKQQRNKKVAEAEKYYHKYERYESYGIKMLILRGLLRQHKKGVQSLNCKETLSLAQKCFASHIEEQMFAGNYVLQLNKSCLTPAKFHYLDKALEHFNSWSTIDDFCMNVLQPLLVKHPKETLTLLRKWNTSKSIWKRRASVVVFTRKIGESGKFTDEALELCENLIWAKEDLVQKGVGWCLKDAMRGNKKKVLDYVKSLRKRGVSQTITAYAVRDLKRRERQEVLQIK